MRLTDLHAFLLSLCLLGGATYFLYDMNRRRSHNLPFKTQRALAIACTVFCAAGILLTLRQH